MALNNSKNPWHVWMPLLLALATVIGMLVGFRLHSLRPSVSMHTKEISSPIPRSNYGRLEEVVRYIDARYVDDIDKDALTEKAIDELLQQLDPHSSFIKSSDVEEVNEQLDGSFGGIGVQFLLIKDTIVVVSPLAGGPSETVGIQPGDKIIEVEDSVIAGKGLHTKELIKLLKGEIGTPVRIGILRKGNSTLLDYTITRDEIPIHSVDIGYKITDDIGYIKINKFSANTYEEFMKALEELVKDNALKNLIIDVRQNPGGYLPQVTRILNQLIAEAGKVMVFTKGRNEGRVDYESHNKNFYRVDNIAVLIDEGSASASEILAGAIQDLDRGIIIGRRSFGKGLVQEQFRLRDGSALRLTVARYYTPSGRSIQKPYQKKNHDSYDADLARRYKNGELFSEDKFIIADTTHYFTEERRYCTWRRRHHARYFYPDRFCVFGYQFPKNKSAHV